MWWVMEEKFVSTLNRGTCHKRDRIRKKNINRLHRISKRRNREDRMQNKFAYGEPIVFHEYEAPEETFIRQNECFELMHDVHGEPFLAKSALTRAELVMIASALLKEEKDENRG